MAGIERRISSRRHDETPWCRRNGRPCVTGDRCRPGRGQDGDAARHRHFHYGANWRVFTAPFNLRTESGEHLEWNYIPEFEHLDAPFEITPGVIIGPGSYQWTTFRTEVNTATKRPWVVDAAWWWGTFYDGTRRTLELGVTVKPNTHLALGARLERNAIVLSAGSFETHLVTLRGDYNFTPNVSWADLVQYDSESRIAGVQSRFRWILKPGNDLFLVLNRGWFREFDGSYSTSFNRESVKLQYTFRF